MLRSRTATGSQVLERGQTYNSLQIVSLAGQGGFSRTANVHGFSSSSTATQTAPTRTAYIQNGRLQNRTETQTQTQTQAQVAPRTAAQTQEATKTEIQPQQTQTGLRTAAGAPPPGDPGGSKTITIFERIKKWFKKRKEKSVEKKKEKKIKSEEKARKKREKQARRKREKKEKADRKRVQQTGRTGGGGLMVPGGRGGNSRIVERREVGEVMVPSSGMNPVEPKPEDPDPGAGGTAIENEKAKEGIVRMRVPEEKEAGCFGCMRFC